jgi:hypothetical protein
VGDELGSRVVAARQVGEVMRLCFLMEKQYWPYSKWFGTAFSELKCAGDVSPILTAVLESSTWKHREQHLNEAYVRVANMHNELGITDSVDPSISQFYARPYQVIVAERFASALMDKIESPFIR